MTPMTLEQRKMLFVLTTAGATFLGIIKEENFNNVLPDDLKETIEKMMETDAPKISETEIIELLRLLS
jgi:hypothetical protein